MEETSPPVELVAMAPAGDVFFVRRAGQVWLIPPPATGEPRLTTQAEIDTALIRHDFDLVQETFPSWVALEVRLQQRAALVTPNVIVDLKEFDEDDVRDVLAIVEDWIAEANTNAAAETLIELIQVDAVRRSDELNERVHALLRRIRQRSSDWMWPRADAADPAYKRVNGSLRSAA